MHYIYSFRLPPLQSLDPSMPNHKFLSLQEVRAPGPKLTDILGPGFNLDDVADIMKNLPEDSTEDSQDSTASLPEKQTQGAPPLGMSTPKVGAQELASPMGGSSRPLGLPSVPTVVPQGALTPTTPTSLTGQRTEVRLSGHKRNWAVFGVLTYERSSLS